MMSKYLLVLVSSFMMFACIGGSEYTKAENALDAGREFIDACLKGDFKKANFYMLPDTANASCLKKVEVEYHLRNRDERSEYREASIQIENVEEITENTVLIYYKNSYDKIQKKIKVLKKDNDWRVDFKYTFNPNL